MINYVLNIILIPVQKEQLFAFRDFPHKYLCGKISNWTVILSHSSHQLLKGRKCIKTEGVFSHFAKLRVLFSIPSCSPAYAYIHMHTFSALKHSTFSYYFVFLFLLYWKCVYSICDFHLSLLCSFLILSSGEKVKQVRVSHFHLSSVLPVGKNPRTLSVLWSISISIAIN